MEPKDTHAAPAWAAALVAELGAAREDLARAVGEVKELRAELAARSEVEPSPILSSARRDPLLDTSALADRWGVSERTVDTIVASGDVVPTYIRGARRFTREAVEAYERSRSGLRRRNARRRGQAAARMAPDRPAIESEARGAAGGDDGV